MSMGRSPPVSLPAARPSGRCSCCPSKARCAQACFERDFRRDLGTDKEIEVDPEPTWTMILDALTVQGVRNMVYSLVERGRDIEPPTVFKCPSLQGDVISRRD